MAAMSAGLAACGKIPFINTFALFLAVRAADPIRSLIAYNGLNVKIAGAYGGFSDSYDGASHQAIEDVSIMRSIPGLTVIVPADEHAARKATLAAAAYKGPVYLRLSRAEVPEVYKPDSPFEIGKAEILLDDEKPEVAIIACGLLVYNSLIAARKLAKEGIKATVINNHTIKPLDEVTLLEMAKKAGAIVTCEEHQQAGGMGSAIAELLAKSNPVPIEFVGVADRFGQSGEPAELMEHYGLGVDDIIEAVKKVISRK